MFWSSVGFEMVPNYGEESKDPKRNVPGCPARSRRYTALAYSLGREGPARQLGKTHPRWHSPHIASISESVIAALIVIGFALFTRSNNPASQAYLQLYGLMAVMGVIVILAVQALVSISIVLYFRRHHEAEVHWWKTMIAPALAFISQAFVVFLQRLYLRQVARADRPRCRCGRDRLRLLPQEPQPGQVRVGWPAHQRRTMSTQDLRQPRGRRCASKLAAAVAVAARGLRIVGGNCCVARADAAWQHVRDRGEV